jgi:hypothetical protein
MLTDEQIEAIALSLYEFKKGEPLDTQRDPHILPFYIREVHFVSNKAIAIQAEQDRRSFIAVGKYVGVTFNAETDIVSEVYKKLDEILTAFREHSQEIAIAQQTEKLSKLLERYVNSQSSSPIHAGAMGSEAGRSVCVGEVGGADDRD